MLRKIIEKRLSLIVIIIGALIVLHNMRGLVSISHYARYHFLFRDLPENLILTRYCFSIFLKILLLVTGIGIILRRDIFRKMILFISWFNILTIWLKHPVSCFRNIVNYMAGQKMLPAIFMEDPELMIWILTVYNYIIDLGFAIFLIYFFTRPKVKEAFITEAKKKAKE